ncbi:MAG: hypothetical protein JJE49_03875 [Peptostreptococcaceae bacterium]|nr:hypothetical protein [Peptostreptococcaceae bacterium]
MTAFASSGSGYESYKGAVKSTIFAKNATVNAQFEVKGNGSICRRFGKSVENDGENTASYYPDIKAPHIEDILKQAGLLKNTFLKQSEAEKRNHYEYVKSRVAGWVYKRTYWAFIDE